jgi:hypothetical protein
VYLLNVVCCCFRLSSSHAVNLRLHDIRSGNAILQRMVVLQVVGVNEAGVGGECVCAYVRACYIDIDTDLCVGSVGVWVSKYARSTGAAWTHWKDDTYTFVDSPVLRKQAHQTTSGWPTKVKKQSPLSPLA